MDHRVTTTGIVAEDHTLTVIVPAEFPPGPVTVSVTAHGQAPEEFAPLSKLLDSGAVGLWEDRDDIGDSVEYARKLREEGWRRAG